jgi:hypothetical protein
MLLGASNIAGVELAFMLNRLVMNSDTVPLREALARHQWQHPPVQAWVTLARPSR